MQKIILTGKYDNCKTGNLISISGDRGKSIGFNGRAIKDLAPKRSFWTIWHDNIGKIDEEENNKYYIEEYYKQVLSKLDPEIILGTIPDKSILLCYEDNNMFCHRHPAAYWFELFLGIKTFEVKTDENYHAQILERPEYIKGILESVIRENYQMHNYECIRAAYLFEKAKRLEREYFECEKESIKTNIPVCNTDAELGWLAASLRIQADDEEQQYQKIKKISL